MSISLRQNHLNKTGSRVFHMISAVIASLIGALGFVLLISAKLRIPWSFDGGVIQGIISSWNDTANTLGNNDYILLPKFNIEEYGSLGGEGFFLLSLFAVIAASIFFIITSNFSWGVLLIIVPEIFVSIISSKEINGVYYILSIISILIILMVMKLRGIWQGILISLMIASIVSSAHILIPDSLKDQVRNNPLKNVSRTINSLYYGEDLLGHGDLALRTKASGEDTALEVKMTRPQSMYLKGFVGGRFDGKSWSDLNDSTYYKNHDLIMALNSQDFNSFGQILQAATLISEGDSEKALEENIVTIKNVGADSHYAFIPYELKELDSLSKNYQKGGDIFYKEKLNRYKSYSYVVGDSQFNRWTDVAGGFFEKALGSSDDAITKFLNRESYYNQFVYDNYTYVGLAERKLMASNIGSSGDQRDGHMDYKLAINSVRNYLENQFVYSEDLGGKQTSSKNELEEFFVSRKGFDVHYASLATLIFRYYGIPARYVEGYLVTEEMIKNLEANDSVEIARGNAHAWTEIYIDGVGFVPLEVTPEYYGVMEEADMTIGISNENLMREYQKQHGNSNLLLDEEPEEEGAGGNENIRFLWYGLLIFGILLLLAIIWSIAKRIFGFISYQREKRNVFYKKEPKDSVAGIFSYMEKEGIAVDMDALELGNRAAYSQESISEDERRFMLLKYKELKKNTRRQIKRNRSILTSILVVMLVITNIFGASAFLSGCGSTEKNKVYSANALNDVIEEISNYLVEEVPDPTIGAVGGDLMVLALKKSGAHIPEGYFNRYYDNVRATLKSKSGILSEDRYTEYERVIIGLDSIGYDGRDVGGYDLTGYLDGYDVITAQGVNAAWYALIAINVAELEIPNEARYVDFVKESIETKEYDGAGLSDYLSIGLQSLSYYRDNQSIKTLVDEGINTLSEYMDSDGTLGNAESTAMCIIALAMNDINPLEDSRFIKDGKTLFDGLMSFYLGDGAFCHTSEIEEANLMATEQALMALDSIKLFNEGEKIY